MPLLEHVDEVLLRYIAVLLVLLLIFEFLSKFFDARNQFIQLFVLLFYFFQTHSFHAELAFDGLDVFLELVVKFHQLALFFQEPLGLRILRVFEISLPQFDRSVVVVCLARALLLDVVLVRFPLFGLLNQDLVVVLVRAQPWPLVGLPARSKQLLFPEVIHVRDLILLLRPLVRVDLVRYHLVQVTQVLHLLSLILELLRLRGNPSHVILLEPLDEIDPLEHVRDVVDPPLLHAQYLHGLVQIEAVVVGVDETLDELLCQLNEAVFLAAALAAILVEEALVFEFHLAACHDLVAARQVTCLAAQERVAALSAVSGLTLSASSSALRESLFELSLLL